MSSHFLIILGLIFPFPSVNALASSCNEGLSHMKMGIEIHGRAMDASLKPLQEGSHSEETTNFRSCKGHSFQLHRHHLWNLHGILNIIGWGTFLPIGAIVARYYRKFPLECREWYSFHILCQSSGYVVGTIGWGIGIWLGNSSKQYTFKTHRVLGIIIFTFTTVQMLAVFLQPKKEDECRKWWDICHHLLGYALVALIVANIFQGISNQSGQAERWKWAYVGMLGVFFLIVVALEVFRWIKSRKSHQQQQMALDNNMYNFT